MSVAIKGYTNDIVAFKTSTVERSMHAQAKTVGVAVRDYMFQFGDVPDSLAVLASTNGFEYINSFIDSRIGYAKVIGLNGQNWRFNRAVVYVQDPFLRVDDATYVTTNECGVDISDSAGFCGNSDSWFVVIETTEVQLMVYQQLSLGLDDTLYRIVKGYNGGMPNQKNDSSSITEGDAEYLADVVGYVGTANNCTGVFLFEEAILTCSDLFAFGGEKTSYYYVSADEVYVGVTTSVLTTNSGDPEFMFRGI
jgi:hypothetical protein